MAKFLLHFRSFAEADQIFGHAGAMALQGEVFRKPMDPDDLDEIPKFLYEIMEFILRQRVREEGLFRKNGNKEKIDEIVEIIDMGEEYPVPDMIEGGADVHSICGVLKLYYREMPDPLLTYELYDQWISAFSMGRDDASRMPYITPLLAKLPATHRRMLADLCRFLSEVAQYEAQNRMGTENLALVFAPNLLRPQELDLSTFAHAGTICQLVQLMVENHTTLFAE